MRVLRAINTAPQAEHKLQCFSLPAAEVQPRGRDEEESGHIGYRLLGSLCYQDAPVHPVAQVCEFAGPAQIHGSM